MSIFSHHDKTVELYCVALIVQYTKFFLRVFLGLSATTIHAQRHTKEVSFPSLQTTYTLIVFPPCASWSRWRKAIFRWMQKYCGIGLFERPLSLTHRTIDFPLATKSCFHGFKPVHREQIQLAIRVAGKWWSENHAHLFKLKHRY